MELYKRIAQTQTALNNCFKTHNEEWEYKHNLKITEYNDLLPSGSGVDNGSSINTDNTNMDKIVILSGWHIMNDGGYYDGWIDFRVVVTPSFDNFDLNIIGNFGKHQDIKDYLYDLFYENLNQEIN
jgi:hypothetical protein